MPSKRTNDSVERILQELNQQQEAKGTLLAGKTFVLTGTLPTMSRKEASPAH